jgi:pyruvate/2-oxoglutarate dehydrogenase complex dihydrolipoamide acyltransferase (E2) component
MRIGIPAIVAPAVATLAFGETFQHPVPDGDTFKFKSFATATLSFDHRIANGVGAANFLNDIKAAIELFAV